MLLAGINMDVLLILRWILFFLPFLQDLSIYMSHCHQDYYEMFNLVLYFSF